MEYAAEPFITLLPRLKNLTFNIDNAETTESNDILHKYAKKIGFVNALPLVEMLTVQPRLIDISYGIHCSNPGIRTLLIGAPKLRNLRLAKLIVLVEIPAGLTRTTLLV